jgi:hypothetical protein
MACRAGTNPTDMHTIRDGEPCAAESTLASRPGLEGGNGNCQPSNVGDKAIDWILAGGPELLDAASIKACHAAGAPTSHPPLQSFAAKSRRAHSRELTAPVTGSPNPRLPGRPLNLQISQAFPSTSLRRRARCQAKKLPDDAIPHPLRVSPFGRPNPVSERR